MLIEEQGLTAYRASPDPVIDLQTGPARLQARQADSYFRTNRLNWIEAIGEPSGFEIYEASMADAEGLLRAMSRINQKFAPELRSQPLEEMLPFRRDMLIKELVGLLVAFGPISSVVGIIDTGVTAPVAQHFRAIDLDAFAEEVHAFAELFEAVEARPTTDQRRQLAREMERDSTRDVHEMQVVVEVTTDYGVRFEARPTTLRALLWQELFGRNDRSSGICRYCGGEVKQPSRRGRPFRYCPKHRSSRHRMAVGAGKQPYTANIVDDN